VLQQRQNQYDRDQENEPGEINEHNDRCFDRIPERSIVMLRTKFVVIHLLFLNVVMGWSQSQYGQELPVGAKADSCTSNLTATPLSDGRFVLCWNRKTGDSTLAVIAQIFDGTGEKKSDPIAVADEQDVSNVSPAVLALDNGRFAISWFRKSSSSSPPITIHVCFFTATGQYACKVMNVNQTSEPLSTKLWMFKKDATTITLDWFAAKPGGGSIWGREITLDGNTPQAESQVYKFGYMVYPNITTSTDGNIFIAWKSNKDESCLALLSRTHTVIHQLYLAYFGFYYPQAPDILPLPENHCLVHWTSFFQGGYGQIYDSLAWATGKVMHFLQTPEDTRPIFLTYGSIVKNLGFVIYGESYAQSNSFYGILAHFFYADGQPFQQQFTVPNSAFKSRPTICSLASGDLVAAWIGLSGYGNGIFAQLMPSPRRALSLMPFKILEPENDASVKTREISLKWQSAKGTTTFYPWEELDYKVLYSKFADGSKAISKTVIKDTSTIIKELESGQTYFWRVTAFNKSGDSLFSSNSNAFFVRYDATAVPDVVPAPESFSLAQNYPNPFNVSTSITFVLPTRGMTTLRIYDLTGRLMAEVFSGDLAAGRHSFIWNGCNADGVAVPSGIYFGRIEHITANGRRIVSTIKMNLIR
jgi:hypothetical protein